MTNIAINGQYPVGGQWAGSTLPGPIWHDAMFGAVANLPVENFVPINPELIDGAQTSLPSLAGMTPAQATKQLSKLDLKTEVSENEVASYQPKGTVAYTSPGAGSTVEPGDTVTIYISNGVPPPPEPDPSPSTSESGGGGAAEPGNSGGNGGEGGGGSGDHSGGGNNGPGHSDGNPGGGNNNN
jgi:hypothetical protein